MFSGSGAGLLRQSLRQAGRRERVLSFADDLSFGPISPPDPEIRFQWMKQHLGVSEDDWAWLPATTHEFWQVATTTKCRCAVWISRRTVAEYSGFLEWVWRLGDKPYDVVDLSDAEATWHMPDGTTKTGRVISLSLLNPDQVQIHAFLDQAKRLSTSESAKYLKMWQQLRVENAPLRIIRNQCLISAPISQFDDVLLSSASERWRKVGRIFGNALTETWDADGIQVGDLVLRARIRALVASGALEGRGDLVDWRHDAEVRLPQRRAPL